MKIAFVPHSSALTVLALLGCASQSLAASNVDDDSRYSYGGNVGWIDWKPDPGSDPEVGGRIENGVCSGYIYSANVGWIHLGDGSPEDGSAYANNSMDDYGVNVDPGGKLTGLAYGANIGWINFGMNYSADTPATARPRVIGGKLYGFAYGANIGWIDLGPTRHGESDIDGDGMPDEWEMDHLENNGLDPSDFVTVITETTDNDGDGSSDLGEYVAGTDPFDGADYLEIIRLTMDTAADLCELTWTSKPGILYDIETCDDLTDWQIAGSDVPASALETTTVDLIVPGLIAIQRMFVRVVPKRPN